MVLPESDTTKAATPIATDALIPSAVYVREVAGETYIATSMLASEFGYDADHIGRLARQGKVKSLREGKRWFISRISLEQYQHDADLQKKVRALESIRITRGTHRKVSLRKPIVPSLALFHIAERIRASRINLGVSLHGGALRFILLALLLFGMSSIRIPTNFENEISILETSHESLTASLERSRAVFSQPVESFLRAPSLRENSTLTLSIPRSPIHESNVLADLQRFNSRILNPLHSIITTFATVMDSQLAYNSQALLAARPFPQTAYRTSPHRIADQQAVLQKSLPLPSWGTSLKLSSIVSSVRESMHDATHYSLEPRYQLVVAEQHVPDGSDFLADIRGFNAKILKPIETGISTVAKIIDAQLSYTSASLLSISGDSLPDLKITSKREAPVIVKDQRVVIQKPLPLPTWGTPTRLSSIPSQTRRTVYAATHFSFESQQVLQKSEKSSVALSTPSIKSPIETLLVKISDVLVLGIEDIADFTYVAYEDFNKSRVSPGTIAKKQTAVVVETPSPRVSKPSPILGPINQAAITIPFLRRSASTPTPLPRTVSSLTPTAADLANVRQIVSTVLNERGITSRTSQGSPTLAAFTELLNDFRAVKEKVNRNVFEQLGYSPAQGTTTIINYTTPTTTGTSGTTDFQGESVTVTGEVIGADITASDTITAATFTGGGLTNCSGSNFLQYNTSTGQFGCAAGGGGSGVKTEVSDIEVLSASTVINFDDEAFNIISSGSTETIVKMDWTNGPASRSANQTITGLWTFSGGASLTSNFEVIGSNRFGINAGNLTDASLEVGGTASVSGAVTFGSTLGVTGITTLGTLNASTTGLGATTLTTLSATGLATFSGGASVTTNFEITGTNSRLGINAGTLTNTSLEVGGAASISGNFTQAGASSFSTGTGAVSLNGTTTAALTFTTTGLATFNGGVSVSTNFELTGNTRLGINAGAVTNTSFEVGGAASVSLAAGQQVTIRAAAVPTSDMMVIDNTGFGVTGAGISALQVNYFGGSIGVGNESSAVRIDMTPGANGDWNALRIVSTAAGAGQELKGIKFEPRAGGAGFSTGVYVGAGWDYSIIGSGGAAFGVTASLSIRGRKFFLVDSGPGSTATGSFAIRSSNTIGSVASISAVLLTTGSVIDITVPVSTTARMEVLLVRNTAGTTVASLSNSGRLALRNSILAHGSSLTCTAVNTPANCIDIAETFPTQDLSLQKAEIAGFDPATGMVVRAINQKLMVGIVSTKPAIVIGNSVRSGADAAEKEEGFVPIALAGRVPVKVSLENGTIKAGDRLTLSASIPGYAMKATQAGMTVGVALSDKEDLTSGNTVMLFVNNSYWSPALSDSVAEAPSLIKTVISQLASVFDITIDKGLIKTVKGIFRTIEIEEGATMYDRVTKQPHCLGLENGIVVVRPGKCDVLVTPVPVPTESVPDPTPDAIPTSDPVAEESPAATTPEPEPTAELTPEPTPEAIPEPIPEPVPPPPSDPVDLSTSSE